MPSWACADYLWSPAGPGSRHAHIAADESSPRSRGRRVLLPGCCRRTGPRHGNRLDRGRRAARRGRRGCRRDHRAPGDGGYHPRRSASGRHARRQFPAQPLHDDHHRRGRRRRHRADRRDQRRLHRHGDDRHLRRRRQRHDHGRDRHPRSSWAGSATTRSTRGVGNDVLFGGDGDDRFIWNPGDGSDIVEGQAGTDTLEFHGSNIAEIFTLAPNGGRATLLRNVAAIVMDVAGTEILELTMLGGNDYVHGQPGRWRRSTTLDIDAGDGTDSGGGRRRQRSHRRRHRRGSQRGQPAGRRRRRSDRRRRRRRHAERRGRQRHDSRRRRRGHDSRAAPATTS